MISFAAGIAGRVVIRRKIKQLIFSSAYRPLAKSASAST